MRNMEKNTTWLEQGDTLFVETLSEWLKMLIRLHDVIKLNGNLTDNQASDYISDMKKS